MPRIVDTYSKGYPLIEGIPYTNYNADEEFLSQINKYFKGLFEFEIVSRKGTGNIRIDYLLKGRFLGDKFSNNVFYVYTFILYEGGNGRSHDDELRTQLGPHNVWNPDLISIKAATNFRDNSSIDLFNKECYCIGIYKQDKECQNVMFVGMPAEVLCKSENEKISPTSAFQTYGENVRLAYINDVYLHRKKFVASSTYNLVIFKPQYFLWYMKNRDELHIKDIDKASEIVDRVRRTTVKTREIKSLDECSNSLNYLTALRAKPFMLLAGISGTGKSRIVRKLAQATVTQELQEKYDGKTYGANFNEVRWNLHRPANFELIQVKPNWHNSMDVVGYLSNIPEPHYEFTPFIEFIAKAWQHPEVPHFLCLDEMNLAPVEEYFAEFLSAIESRSKDGGEYRTDPIIKAFNSFNQHDSDVVCDRMVNKLFPQFDASQADSPLSKVIAEIKTKGLSLPENLIVIGTVNMDETTFSFSRKVLDRAMSIEMNEVNYDSFLEDATDDELKAIVEEFGEDLNELLVNRHIHAKEVVADLEKATDVIKYLETINNLLEGTPFKLGYRAANEALIYLQSTIDFVMDNFAQAMDNFTLMKILSRIEGDESKLRITDSEADRERLANAGLNMSELGENPTILEALRAIIVSRLGERLVNTNESENDEMQSGQNATSEKLKSIVKIDQMISQLNRDHFVSYWN